DGPVQPAERPGGDATDRGVKEREPPERAVRELGGEPTIPLGEARSFERRGEREVRVGPLLGDAADDLEGHGARGCFPPGRPVTPFRHAPISRAGATQAARPARAGSHGRTPPRSSGGGPPAAPRPATPPGLRRPPPR